MTSFFEHNCYKCGCIDEAKFILGSTHLKQVCNGCGCYVKFFDKKLVPPIPEIKMRIWALSGSNLELINNVKKEMLFPEGLTGLYGQVSYWNLYLKIRKEVAHLFS